MKLKYYYLFSLTGLIVILLLLLCSCFLADTEYTLTVMIGEGLIGTPETGSYVYPEFAEVEYNFEADEGMNFPVLFMNGIRKIFPFGALKMYRDIELVVEQADIRGEWKFTLREEGKENQTIVITFSGNDIYSGTFTDDRNLSGSRAIQGSDLTITFDNWVDYKLTGFNSISNGIWTGEGRTGTWSSLEN